MTHGVPGLEELIAVRKDERNQAQVDYTRAMAGRVDAALGPRVLQALEQDFPEGWEIHHASATRRFLFRRGEYHLGVNAVQGAARVDVELRFVDRRFAVLTKRAEINEVGEDWFLEAIEMLASQISERLVNPRNFT